MADQYRNFDELSRNETSGIDYGILVRRARDAFAIAAPHGGGIEPGTSEIADAIAGGELSFYAFEGLKPSGNSALHITSTRFDEPMCVALAADTGAVVTIHGEDSGGAGSAVFMGGLDEELGGLLSEALRRTNFTVCRHPDPRLQGREPANLCNRGTTGKGVQLELSRAVRAEMFASLSREGRKSKTARFYDFVEAIRGVLMARLIACDAGVAASGAD